MCLCAYMSLSFCSSDSCGPACDSLQMMHTKFASTAIYLERRNSTQFEPYFVFARSCSMFSATSRAMCKVNCIGGTRYCVLSNQLNRRNYRGEDIAYENLRQLCMFEQFKRWNRRELFFQYNSRFARSCTMESGKFTTVHDASCSDSVLRGAIAYTLSSRSAHHFNLDEFNTCAHIAQNGSFVDVDAEIPILERQLDAMIDAENSGRGLVRYLPTIVINNAQFRGSISYKGVLSALCSGFEEGSEPAVCLSSAYQNADDCKSGDDTCWRTVQHIGEVFHGQDMRSKRNRTVTACVDTFRGYTCVCPKGWEGDGYACRDIDECATPNLNRCDQTCTNTQGSYLCTCNEGYRRVGSTGCIVDNFCDRPPLPRNGGCEGVCNPRTGACSCGHGLELDIDKKSCIDIDECTNGSAQCGSSATCVNLDPRLDELGRGFACRCDDEGMVLEAIEMHDCIAHANFVKNTSGDDAGKASSGRRSAAIAIGITSAVVCATAALIVVWRMRARMREECKAILLQYLPLEDFVPKSSATKDENASVTATSGGLAVHASAI